MSKLKPPAKWSELQCCTRNGYALVMQGLATVVRVAQSEDLKYALPAGQWLVDYGEGLMREKQAQKAVLQVPAPSSRESVIAELRGLYAKALGASPLVVQAESVEATAEPIPRDQSKPRD